MIHFRNLSIENWRQFDSVNLGFGARTTILTGANGCGKTSILSVLGRHFGWEINFVSTPFVSKRNKRRFYSEFVRKSRGASAKGLTTSIPEDLDEGGRASNDAALVGAITYSDGRSSQLRSPSGRSAKAQYQLEYSDIPRIDGLFIPSHRPAASYHKILSIPTDPKSNAQQYQEYQQILQQVFNGSKITNPGSVSKQSLISLALFGYGNAAVAPNDEYRDLFEAFQDVLRILLPEKLGFQRLEIRMPDVVLITESGEFALDAMSGGVNALFTIAWQIQMFGWRKEECTVLIDEPENHLHPSMQRSLMPSLASAFPNYRFIVATHSPFIVTSDAKANVYSLTHNESRRIVSHHLEAADLAASPEKVLRDILEVPTSIPIWAIDALRSALQEYSAHSSNPEAMNSLFSRLRELGLNAAVSDLPSAIGE